MNRILRTLFHAAAGAAFAAASAGAFAQAFPNKPIRWLVGYPAGSGLDFVSRVVAEQMTKTLGQAIVVDNRTGAAGAIAATAVVQSPADGYTVLCTDMGTYALNPHLYSKLSYDSKRDLKMVGLMVSMELLLKSSDSRLTHLHSAADRSVNVLCVITSSLRLASLLTPSGKTEIKL